MKLPVFLLVVLALLCANFSFGQFSNYMSPYEAVDVLERGTLVVRLGTSSAKLKALDKMMANANNAADRARVSQLIEKTKLDAQQTNKFLMQAFRENYDFSKLLFMPDTLAVKLKEGATQGIFLDTLLHLDKSLALTGDFLVAAYGVGSPNVEADLQGISVMAPDLTQIQHDYLFYVGRAYVWRALDESFMGANGVEHYAKLVRKLQRRLKRVAEAN